jgi:molybdate/tungstate transport system substrate-binding protein
MKASRFIIFLISLYISIPLFLSCSSHKEGNKGNTGDLTLFHAACFSPVIDTIRTDSEKDLKIRLRTEASGSQVVLRKIAELGRECDLMMIADSRLFKEIASSVCTWRLDFAHDEMVLGVGIRAKRVDEAEKDWISVLLDEDINFGRVDENLGPIGYRTLLVWKLKDNNRDLAEQLKAKCNKIVDDVSHLAVLLKAGDLEYGFLYRSTCINYDIRYIPLEKGINLGSMDVDYSGAEVVFEKLDGSKKQMIKIKGAPITMSLSIPSSAGNKNGAIMFIRYILNNHAGQFKKHGFTFFKPRFYGEEKEYTMFKNYADYSGRF